LLLVKVLLPCFRGRSEHQQLNTQQQWHSQQQWGPNSNASGKKNTVLLTVWAALAGRNS
jgi:hypothetical protein